MFKPGPSVWTATIQNVPLTVLFTLTRDTLHTTGLFEATSTPVELWKYANFTEPVFLSFSQALNKFLDAGASLSRPVRFDLCPTNRSVTVSLDQRHWWAMQVSTVLTLDWMDFEVIFQQINLNTAPTFFTSEPRGEVSAILSKFRQNPNEILAILFRVLFSQKRFFLLSRIFRP